MQITICTYGSVKADPVPDSTTRAIDRFFDRIDDAVETADRVLNRGKSTEDKLQQKRTKRRPVIDAESAPKTAPKAKEAPSAGPPTVTKKAHFYIVEAVDPKSGDTIFVVTDGGNARTECATREFANQILQALEKNA